MADEARRDEEHRKDTATGMLVGVYGLTSFAIVAFLGGYWMWSSLGAQHEQVVPVGIAMFLGVVTPVTVIAIRHQIRLTRIRLIDLFADSLGLPKRKLTRKEIAEAEKAKLSNARAPQDGEFVLSFEFVKGKYYVDLELKENEEPKLSRVPRFPMMLHADWMLLLCAVPFIVASVCGAYLLFAPLGSVLDYNGTTEFPLWPSVLTLGGSPMLVIETKALFTAQHSNTVTIAALAFAGAYFYCARLLLRAVAVFDLSPVTFLRCFAHVVLAVLLAVVIFRVTPSAEGVASFAKETNLALNPWAGGPEPKCAAAPVAPAPAPACPPAAPPVAAPVPAPAAPPAPPQAAGAGSDKAAKPLRGDSPIGKPAPVNQKNQTYEAVDVNLAKELAHEAEVSPPTDGVKSFWLILAFALGFLPDAALEYVLRKSGLNFKERYKELDKHSKSVPLTLLDGIDHYIAFRLEEANIFDVQNLATSNPIMLHIESPYGIYQTIDWVAQAQLCTVVGPERFLALKMMNVRTIFDLERGVLSKGITDEVVRLIGATLMSDNHRDKDTRHFFGMLPTTLDGRTPAQALAGLTSPRADLSPLAIKQFVWLMIDDLHVHRLRQIWKFMGLKLDPKNRGFNEEGDEPAPGADDGPPNPPNPPEPTPPGPTPPEPPAPEPVEPPAPNPVGPTPEPEPVEPPQPTPADPPAPEPAEPPTPAPVEPTPPTEPIAPDPAEPTPAPSSPRGQGVRSGG